MSSRKNNKRPRNSSASKSAAEDEDDTDNNSSSSSAPMIHPDPIGSISSAIAAGISSSETDPPQEDEDDSAELPTPIKLSKELCRIVDSTRYSRGESLRALTRLLTALRLLGRDGRFKIFETI